MRIPANSEIHPDKLTKYLLVERPRGDKSRLLKSIGFTPADPSALDAAIRRHASEGEAEARESDVYGDRFLLRGTLIGLTGELRIESIWIRRAGENVLRFVTLKPSKD